MSLEEYAKDKLWPILVETVHALVLFPNHKAYTRETLLQEKQDITPMELASRLNIPFGEALIVLYELAEERKAELQTGA